MPFGSAPSTQSSEAVQSAVQVLARNLVREMRQSGWTRAQMLSMASALVVELTQELRESVRPPSP